MLNLFRKVFFGYKPDEIQNHLNSLESNHQQKITALQAEVEKAKNDLNRFEEEVKTLQTKLDSFISREQSNEKNQASVLAAQTKEIHPENSAYTIQLVSFLNARHFVIFGQNQGPVHAHSWQMHLKIQIPSHKSEQIPFAKIIGSINSIITHYEKTVLNEIYPFNIVQPTTENIAMYFFNRLDSILLEFGLNLDNLAVWETPTKGVEVNQRNSEFDVLPENVEKEVAAAAFNSAIKNSEQSKHSPEKKTGEKVSKLRNIKEKLFKKEITYFTYPSSRYALHALLITCIAVIAYYQILTPQLRLHYPWGSDTWGHLYKAEFLYQQLLQGNYFPQFTEYWYNGVQPFRYWAPLPYYAIAVLRFFCTDIFIAGNYFIFASALLGGLSLLFFAGRIGIWPATIAGVIWSVWIDNVRVAFSEGNLPRVLATALLPILVIFFLKLIEERKNLLTVIATISLIHLVILCHAMIGAVYCICLTLFAFFFWALGGCRLNTLIKAVFIIFIGIISSCWWLLPSLGGGITMINPEAVREIVQFVSANISLNPLQRFSNREVFYWGISLFFALIALFITWREKLTWAKSLALCGVILIIITFPSARLFFLLMPLSHLLWPLRFSSFAALALIISSLSFYPLTEKLSLAAGYQTIKKWGIICLIALILLLDCFFSMRLLAHTGAKSYTLLESAEYLLAAPGWRIATIDLSRLGSVPSYLFSEVAGKEQVFGWAWQGATTSNNIMLLNMGIEYQYYPFLLRSCVLLGATDLLVKNDVIEKPELFTKLAKGAGYEEITNIDEISLWHGPVDRPYLVVKNNDVLVIGKHAGTIAIQFPNVEMGRSPYLDRYSLEHLQNYSTVILSGAQWWSKTESEQLIREYISSGGRVVVELSGLPENVLAKQPEFLDVYGETVILEGQLELFNSSGESFLLQPFAPEDLQLWKTYVPQGLNKEEMSFDYYGVKAPILGYKLVEGNKVWFIGGNLSYHTFLTKDPLAIQILEEIFELDLQYNSDELIPLLAYEASERGYIMEYEIEREIDAVVPVAALDGMKVKVDGNICPYSTFENLLRMELPAGKHRIEIVLEKTPSYLWGLVLTLLSPFLLTGVILYFNKFDKDEDVKQDEQANI